MDGAPVGTLDGLVVTTTIDGFSVGTDEVGATVGPGVGSTDGRTVVARTVGSAVGRSVLGTAVGV